MEETANMSVEQMKALISELGLSVAIDGPSGSGKSTVARALARELGIGYLDTGAMYRALTWYCLDAGLPLDDRAAVAGAADSFPLSITTSPDDFRVTVGNTDVTEQIRESRISKEVSKAATNLDVRESLVRQQREIINAARQCGNGMVTEGRDITTVVAPDADVRLLLTASAEARMKRRAAQLLGEGVDEAAIESMRSEVVGRDAKDSTVVNFQEATEGQILVDSSALDAQQTLQLVLDYVGQNLAQRAEQAEADNARVRAMRAALSNYELYEEDQNVLDGEVPFEELETSTSGNPVLAIVGRPNVGKASLLNQLARENRVVVENTACTTRDPVDELIEMAGRQWWFVDTAGIRRKMHRTSGADYYASIRTQAAIEKAEVAMVLLDATEPLSEQDVRIVQAALDSGRALVIVNNKWDLVDEDRRLDLQNEQERDLAHVAWAPRINLSALTGWHTNRIVRALDTSLRSWDMRISTAKLNSFLGELVAATPHPVRGGKQPRILFATQVSARPPRFVSFTTGFLDPGYRRFIERRLRETFGFEGTPIKISVRVREKKRR